MRVYVSGVCAEMSSDYAATPGAGRARCRKGDPAFAQRAVTAQDRAAFYDAELRRHQEHFSAALVIGPTDQVLDVGCGAGLTTCAAASAAAAGGVVGVDVSNEMLEIARGRAENAGLLAVHSTPGGVLFDSRAWIVTARKVGPDRSVV